MNGNCKYCSNSFYDFELSVGTCDTSSWAVINVHDNSVYLELITSGYDNHEKDKVEIYYCPWCGRQLEAKINNELKGE